MFKKLIDKIGNYIGNYIIERSFMMAGNNILEDDFGIKSAKTREAFLTICAQKMKNVKLKEACIGEGKNGLELKLKYIDEKKTTLPLDPDVKYIEHYIDGSYSMLSFQQEDEVVKLHVDASGEKGYYLKLEITSAKKDT